MSLTISVISDVVCPWCFMGKQRLERALRETGLEATTTVEWLPFELNPGMPEGGMPRRDYLAGKFGPGQADAIHARLTAAGRGDGVAFAFDRLLVTPNSRRAHMLIAFAGSQGRGGEVVEGLFRAYFEEALDIGNPDTLLAIATGAGLGRAETIAALGTEALHDGVVASERQSAAMGVGGVPFFIVDRSWAVSGAQSPDAWIEALRERVKPRPVAATA